MVAKKTLVLSGIDEGPQLIWLTLVSLWLALAVILGLIGIALWAMGVPLVFSARGGRWWLGADCRPCNRNCAGSRRAGVRAGWPLPLAPSRRAPRWRWVIVGALIVMVFWVLGWLLFSLYVAASGKYATTYGSLGAVIILLTWLYITALIMLVGGELNA